jgi:hypothetical protein
MEDLDLLYDDDYDDDAGLISDNYEEEKGGAANQGYVKETIDIDEEILDELSI